MTNQEWHEEWMERFETFIWKDKKLREFRDVKSLIAQQAIVMLQKVVTGQIHEDLYHPDVLSEDQKLILEEAKTYLTFFPKLVRCRECADLWPCVPSLDHFDSTKHEPNRLEAFKDDPEPTEGAIS